MAERRPLGIITAALGLARVVLREQQRMLSELTSRYAQDRILYVTCAVELAAFDQPEFDDRVARAQAGVMRAPLIPGWLASGRRGRAFYRFGVIMTPRDRGRRHLASLVAGRDPAKEVQAFGLAGFLRARHDRLYDERIEQMRRISSRQLRGMAAADLASAMTIAAAIAGILRLAVSRRLARTRARRRAGRRSLGVSRSRSAPWRRRG